jgi:hypothetical protein
MTLPIEQWHRAARSSFTLGTECGVYALFLRNPAALPTITSGREGLIYIGLAAGQGGLRERCHFAGKTRTHSPRRSLATLLADDLGLVPVAHPGGKWGLDAVSEAKLNAWMHEHLHLAIEPCSNPEARETELIALHAPPLNLTKCPQSAQHRMVSEARARMATSVVLAAPKPKAQLKVARHFVGHEIDTPNAIALRFGLDPKSYRQRLRETITWYHKPQDWTFPVDSSEWRDMIAVAERMAR